MKRRTFLKALGAAVLAPLATVRAMAAPRIKNVVYSSGGSDDNSSYRVRALAQSMLRMKERVAANVLNNAFTLTI